MSATDRAEAPWLGLTSQRYDHNFPSMATVTVRSTYSLDLETVRRLEALAKRWDTSKSGALRRAIRLASEDARPTVNEKLAALDELQRLLALDERSAAEWCAEVQEERAAWTDRLSRLSR